MEEAKAPAKGLIRAAVEKFNALSDQYSGILSAQAFASAFSRANYGMANQPSVQNARIKGISSLPVDYTKDQIGEYLRYPYSHEQELRETAEILRWTNYPFFKINKTEQDIPTDRYYFKPMYLTGEEGKTERFQREAVLLDRLNKEIKPEATLHRIRGEALLQARRFTRRGFRRTRRTTSSTTLFWNSCRRTGVRSSDGTTFPAGRYPLT